MRGSEYAELAAFVAVARERSFRRAAAQLGLSPSALSHTVRSLEERLGARLFHRTTRSVAPTEAGLALYERVAPALADIHSAVDVAKGAAGSPAGTVRINLPKLAAHLLAPKLARFTKEHPFVRLELTTDDGFADIVAGGFDAGVRPGEHLHGDMISVRVTPDLRSAIAGSPAYFARRPPPHTPSDLRDHACLNYRFDHSGALYRWPLAKQGRPSAVTVDGPLAVNDMDVLVSAALNGAGLVVTLEDHVAQHIESGRLVRVLEDWCPPFPGFHLYYPGHRQMPPALTALAESLRHRL